MPAAAKRHALAIVILGGLALGSGCEESVRPCEEYAAFAETFASACPGLDWTCEDPETGYRNLPPQVQQDFDWCSDCFRLRETEEPDRDCSTAPLSEQACGVLLDETLDASCFSQL